jgi:hypothetical protein
MQLATQLSRISGVLLLLAGLSVAQQDTAPKGTGNKDAGTQAMRPYPAAQGAGGASEQPGEALEKVPDTRPPSGVLGLTLGSLKGRQNVISLNFDVGQVFDSNPGILGRGSDYEGATSLRGDLSLRHAMRRGDLALDYQGGAVFYNDHTQTNWFPQLSFSVPFAMRRWTIYLAENLTYTPEGSYGAGLGFADYGASVAQGGITSNFTPQQNVFTPIASRLSSTSAVQVQYGLSPRSSWTAGVSYGTLYFPDGGLENSHQINVRSGYNRNLTARDTVSFFYDYGTYKTEGINLSTDSHAAQIAYTRRVTGRLSFSVSGGPQFVTQLGSTERSVSLTAASSVQYQLRRTAATLSYFRGTSGGAGVLPGATSHTIQAGISRTITRNLSVGTSGTISKTTSLDGRTEFRSGGAGVQVRRAIGHRASVYFTYAFQRQVSDGSCGLLCSGLSRQVFGFGFGWGPRPWIIR